MLQFLHQIINGIRIDSVKMAAGDQLEWVVSDPEGLRDKPRDAIRLIVSGSVRLDLNNDFTIVLNSGSTTDEYKPKVGSGGFAPNLKVTYTALEDSLYLCAAKQNSVATRTFITVDNSGTIDVPAQTLVIPTATSNIGEVILQIGDVYFAENQTTLITEPGSVVALTQFN